MYEEKTYKNILEDLIKKVPEGTAKSEGSLVHNALAASAYEHEKSYIEMNYMHREAFMDTCLEYESAEARAEERGIIPEEPTSAYVKGNFNTDVPVGTRFSLNAYNYRVTKKLEGNTYLLMCEETGSKPNTNFGELTAIDFVEGLETAEITELIIPGTDKETIEHLKERYYKSFDVKAFGGNVEDYKTRTNEIEGVGGTKVFPVWNGGGTVKLVIIASDYNVPSEELVKEVQEKICPVPYMGYGIAPIGHDTTVKGCEGVKVNVASIMTFEDGYSFETLKTEIISEVDKYLASLRETWADNEKTTVYISRLESGLLNIKGVVDIRDTKLNEKAENLILNAEELPVPGEVNIS